MIVEMADHPRNSCGSFTNGSAAIKALSSLPAGRVSSVFSRCQRSLVVGDDVPIGANHKDTVGISLHLCREQ
jgi:hypothetical protein